jgi:hypothetical protein
MAGIIRQVRSIVVSADSPRADDISGLIGLMVALCARDVRCPVVRHAKSNKRTCTLHVIHKCQSIGGADGGTDSNTEAHDHRFSILINVGRRAGEILHLGIVVSEGSARHTCFAGVTSTKIVLDCKDTAILLSSRLNLLEYLWKAQIL